MGEADGWLQQADRSLAVRALEAACAAFDRAEACGADANLCSGGRWQTAMLRGDYPAAWRESDAIRAREGPDEHRFWNGEDLDGKRVIVRCLHGFGDAVQMLRYAPLLRERAANVIVEVPPRLLPLASFFRGVEQVITWGEDAPHLPPAWDIQVEVMELPYLFRTTLDQLPLTERYLELPGSLVSQAATCMGTAGRRRVGVVWTGGEWNPERSVPFMLLRPLLGEDGVQWWNLQGGASAHDADGTMRNNVAAITGDGLLALAATVANLDLVITVDTLAAHLAGALGRPAWLMLQYAADWRWMTGREDSPWYPSLRLFRQSAPGDWPGVVARLRQALIA